MSGTVCEDDLLVMVLTVLAANTELREEKECLGNSGVDRILAVEEFIPALHGS